MEKFHVEQDPQGMESLERELLTRSEGHEKAERLAKIHIIATHMAAQTQVG